MVGFLTELIGLPRCRLLSEAVGTAGTEQGSAVHAAAGRDQGPDGVIS